MEKIWNEMYEAAKAVLNERRISEYVTCGEVSAAVCSKSGKIYTGVCIDTCSTLGICAERNAISTAVAMGEKSKLVKIAIYSPNTTKCVPCGACRQWLQEFEQGQNVQVVLEDENDKLIIYGLSELLPHSFSSNLL